MKTKEEIDQRIRELEVEKEATRSTVEKLSMVSELSSLYWVLTQ